MKKIAILGCENSHANTFLNFIKTEKKFSDIEVVGVYSDDSAAAEKLNNDFGVPVLDNYDSAVGKVDGVVITARHGDNHLKYARPYMQKGMVMFMDKPITVSEEDALEFARLAVENGVKVSGGSSLRFDAWVQELRSDVLNKVGGETLGGYVRCPISLENEYGGFFFYAQHLVEIVEEIYGRYPNAVKTFRNGKQITAVFRYDSYDIVGLFTDGNYKYFAMRAAEETVKAENFAVLGTSPCFYAEFDEFYELLSGGEQQASFEDIIAPVFALNALYRSLKSGNEEPVKEFKI